MPLCWTTRTADGKWTLKSSRPKINRDFWDFFSLFWLLFKSHNNRAKSCLIINPFRVRVFRIFTIFMILHECSKQKIRILNDAFSRLDIFASRVGWFEIIESFVLLVRNLRTDGSKVACHFVRWIPAADRLMCSVFKNSRNRGNGSDLYIQECFGLNSLRTHY